MSPASIVACRGSSGTIFPRASATARGASSIDSPRPACMGRSSSSAGWPSGNRSLVRRHQGTPVTRSAVTVTPIASSTSRRRSSSASICAWRGWCWRTSSARESPPTGAELLDHATLAVGLGHSAGRRVPLRFEHLSDSSRSLRHRRDAAATAHASSVREGQLWEFPPPVWRLMKYPLPVGGGGYFRLYPYRLTRRGLRAINAAGRPFAVYLHPWEFDPEQPRLRPGAMRAFRHYVESATGPSNAWCGCCRISASARCRKHWPSGCPLTGAAARAA